MGNERDYNLQLATVGWKRREAYTPTNSSYMTIAVTAVVGHRIHIGYIGMTNIGSGAASVGRIVATDGGGLVVYDSASDVRAGVQSWSPPNGFYRDFPVPLVSGVGVNMTVVATCTHLGTPAHFSYTYRLIPD